jgi:hypothetical protein
LLDIHVYQLIGPATIVRSSVEEALLVVKALLALSMIGSAHRAADTTDCVLVRPYGAQKLNDKRLQ